MSNNWLNLIIRFFLELMALYSIGLYFFTWGEGYIQYFLAFVIPIVLAVSWAMFRYPNDPKKEPIFPIGGKSRLFFEACFFTLAIYGLNKIGHANWSKYLLYAVLFHYFVSYDRIYRLWKNNP